VDTFIEDRGEQQFADNQNNRNLRDALDASDQDPQLDTNPLEALKQNPADERYRRIELPGALEGGRGSSGGGSGLTRRTRRVLLALLLIIVVGAIAPFAWNYLQSYESTDDAQIDGHIDPLSSRINGTVIRVHAEDDDRVKAGELLVEIDPRDYEVAVAQAKARLALAVAQVASAKQDYAAALANVREGDAANFRAQRDA
jgi:Biotin-lipoyl like